MWRVDSIVDADGHQVPKRSGWDLSDLQKRPNWRIVLVSDIGEQVKVAVNQHTMYSELRSYWPYGFIDDGFQVRIIPVDSVAYEFLSLVESVEPVIDTYRKCYIDPLDVERSLWVNYGIPFRYNSLLDLLANVSIIYKDNWRVDSYTICGNGYAGWIVYFTDGVKARRVVDKRILYNKLAK